MHVAPEVAVDGADTSNLVDNVGNGHAMDTDCNQSEACRVDELALPSPLGGGTLRVHEDQVRLLVRCSRLVPSDPSVRYSFRAHTE